jgi:type II secretory pathway predicted ATPase ExeA
MYRYFYGINDFPFGACPDPRFLYKLPHVQEALACLQYGIASRKGFVVMTGEVGTGKTTLLKSVLSSFTDRRIHTAFVFNPRLDTLDFLEFVLADFGIPATPRGRPGMPQTKSGMLMQLNRWLIDRFRSGELCAIVVDEAQNLSWELLEEIRLLTNLETSSEKLVQIVLSGQPELEEKLRDPSVRQLRQRISLWCRTKPLTAEETRAYISNRLRIVGATQPVFSPDAVQVVHQYSKGIPRVVNLICEHSMISAYVEQIKPIPPRIVESVCKELDLDSQPFVLSPMALSGVPEEPMSAAMPDPMNPAASSSNTWKDIEL